MNLPQYQRFVESLTSPEANTTEKLIKRLDTLNTSNSNSNVNITLLLNSAVGLTAECGEFADIPKKIVWQGKPLDDDIIFHMKRELGDVIFYWINACRSLNIDPQDVIDENISKLSSRYTGGKFSVNQSENKKTGDI